MELKEEENQAVRWRYWSIHAMWREA